MGSRLSTFHCITLLALLLLLVPAHAPGQNGSADDHTLDAATEARATAELTEARRLADQGSFAEARTKYQDVLSKTSDPEEAARVGSLLSQLAAKEKQHHRLRDEAHLEEAALLGEDGKIVEARKAYLALIDNAKTPNVVARARAALSNLPRTTGFRPWLDSIWTQLSKHLAQGIIWAVTALGAIVLLTGAYLLLRLARGGVSRIRRRWILDPLEGWKGAGELVLAQISEVRAHGFPSTIGHVGALKRPFSDTQIRFAPATPELTLPVELLPTVGGIKLDAVANWLRDVSRWLRGSARRIKGRWTMADSKVTIRLFVWRSATEVWAVSGEDKDSPEGRLSAARTASEKMYYLITRPSATATEAQAAPGIQRGLKALEKYLSGRGDDNSLKDAEKAFQEAADASESADEPRFYLGVALELREEHDRAIEILRDLSQSAKDDELKEWAAYNEAIAHFRKYNPEELERAEEMLQARAAKIQSGRLSPLEAFVLIKLAEVIAHKPIFKEYHADSAESLKGVQKLASRVERALESRGEDWTKELVRQCRWSVHNARGNVFLYVATKVPDEHFPIVDSIEARRLHYLSRALEEFRKTERLGAPGVETLTNLGTVLGEHGKRLRNQNQEAAEREVAEARKCLERCINVNKRYEYAYYRLAENWLDIEGDPDKALGVVERFRATGRKAEIPGFRGLIDRLGRERGKRAQRGPS